MHSHDGEQFRCVPEGERTLHCGGTVPFAGKGRAAAFSGGDLPEAPGGGWLFFS
jgi:hypothetical protein